MYTQKIKLIHDAIDGLQVIAKKRYTDS